MMDPQKKHKRFLAFSFDHYYPGGGLGDIAGTFDTLEEAVEFLGNGYCADFRYVYDRESGQTVDVEFSY